jgi:hypothetical protein
MKAYIDEKTEDLGKEILRLQDFAFECDILLQPDSDWEIVRKKRNFLLRATDWTMIQGATVDQREWSAYRQQLRDLPQRFKGAELTDLVWPKQPPTLGPNTIEEK